jgi:hypothetical protein
MARIACTKPGGLPLPGFTLNGPAEGEDYGVTIVDDYTWQIWYAADGNNHGPLVANRVVWQLPPEV